MWSYRNDQKDDIVTATAGPSTIPGPSTIQDLTTFDASNLPTSDPGVAGKLYVSTGTLKVSAG